MNQLCYPSLYRLGTFFLLQTNRAVRGGVLSSYQFGTYTSTRKAIVTAHFKNIANNSFSVYVYDCTCTESDIYAYVYADA